IYNLTGVYTPPETNGNYVVFGYNETLVTLKADGTEEWTKEVGSVWKGAPHINEGVIYFGTLDNNLYAVDLSDGFTKWKVATEGWIMSTPYVSDYVYFGSNDGKIYAVEKNLGRIKWSAKTGEAVQSTGTTGTLAGRSVLFIGSQDGNLYAIDTSDGTVVLKYPTKGWAHSPILNGKIILFGSHDGSVYAVGTERACTFEEPGSDYILGYKEVYLKGKAFSEYGTVSVSIRLNGGEWTKVDVENSNWNYLLDPNQLQFGIVKIECRVTDASGSEGAPYTLLSLIRSEDVPLEKFYLVLPGSVNIGQEFTVIVKDEADKPVNNMQLTFDGKTYNVNEEIKLTANRGGILTVLAEKKGFESYETTITVKQSSEMNTIYLVIGVLVVVLVIYFLYKKFFGEKQVTQQ
ncbi:PQQ-like beta-propeller repeat protein, partial [Candidatus Micrarchaeota archaeon]|nr:PQQ-like beta-propeller repeat protein [Candidatus Micrarchaeota archaeon]